jgi:hypothetical protein
MALEQRNGSLYYYYRSERVGGRVRKVYLGSGRLAELWAEAERVERERREADREREHAELERLESLAAPVLEIDEAADILARARLIAAGCHRHKGEWRRARGEARNS